MKKTTLAVTELLRPRNMIISFIGVIAGMMLVSKTVTLTPETLAAAVSAAIILGGGNALNDFYDYEADKVNRPKRPLSSGRIRRDDARQIALLLFLAGIILAVFINIYCLLLAIVNATILAAYAKYSKKALFISNLAVSYLSASVFAYGAASILQTQLFSLNGAGMLAVLIGSSFFMTASREIIKDIEDVKGDAKIKADTLPTRLGAKGANMIAILAGLMAITISLTPMLAQTTGFNKTAYALFITPANLIFISSYLTTPAKSQKRIVAGMLISLLAFMAGRLV
jgi:geranylgeranylglycerol-phosphate geranylgeranyltransferase